MNEVNLKTGDRVNLLPQMDLYLVLRDAILPKSLSFTIEKNGQYHGKYISDGEGLITFGNNGYVITLSLSPTEALSLELNKPQQNYS